MFEGIILIIRELWLERNTDRHRPLQGQQRIAKITIATQTVTDLYSLQSLIMPQHESRYFCDFIEGNTGAISPGNVGMGHKVENRNIPEYQASKVDIKENDSTEIEDLGS